MLLSRRSPSASSMSFLTEEGTGAQRGRMVRWKYPQEQKMALKGPQPWLVAGHLRPHFPGQPQTPLGHPAKRWMKSGLVCGTTLPTQQSCPGDALPMARPGLFAKPPSSLRL